MVTLEYSLELLFAHILFALAVAWGIAARRYSRLELARAFPWFALFALLFYGYEVSRHGLFGMLASTSLALLFYGMAFIALWCAGFCLLPYTTFQRNSLLRGICVLLSGFWVVTVQIAVPTYLPAQPLTQGFTLLFVFPIITFVAYALRRHAQERIRPLQAPHIYNTLRTGGVAFFIFGGLWTFQMLASPSAPWDILLKGIQVVLLAVFAWAMIRGLDIFEVETRNRLDAMEIAQVRILERQRIARDLHDHALQDVYAAGLFLQELESKLPAALQGDLHRAQEALKTAQRRLREWLYSLQEPQTDQDIDLTHALAAIVDEARRISGANITLHVDNLPAWNAQRAAHLLSFVREALANAIRHAESPDIEVRLRREGDQIRLEIIDYGRGFVQPVQPGFGLRNMRERALLLGGKMYIDSRPGQGTRVVLTAPLTLF